MKTMLLQAVLVAVLCGCAAQPVLVPASTASIASGTETTAYAERSGVRVWVDGAAWNSDPWNLAEWMTPVNVSVENKSDRQIRVAYADFTLVGASGFRYPAIPPLPGQRPVSSLTPGGGVVVLAAHHPGLRHLPPPAHFPHHRFLLAPHYYFWWPGALVWGLTFPYDAAYYGRYSWPANLPTDDMLSLAFPEGVVQDDGRVQGFLYFQGVGRRERQVTFELKLVDATENRAFDQIQVPLNVHLD